MEENAEQEERPPLKTSGKLFSIFEGSEVMEGSSDGIEIPDGVGGEGIEVGSSLTVIEGSCDGVKLPDGVDVEGITVGRSLTEGNVEGAVVGQ